MNCRRALISAALLLQTMITFAQDQKPPTPADGYTVHVSAPHVVNGKVMGPFHHYCKVMSPDPVIVCLIFDSTDANASLTQVEYIIAKKLTRTGVSRENWNIYWHDHQQEIATGRVQVHDLPPDKAKEVAELVATTDGIIFSFDFNGVLPTGRVTHPQAVGHKPMTAAEYGKSRQLAVAESADRTCGRGCDLYIQSAAGMATEQQDVPLEDSASLKKPQ